MANLKQILFLWLLLVTCSSLPFRSHERDQNDPFWKQWEEDEKESQSTFLTLLIIFFAIVAAMLSIFCLISRCERRRNQQLETFQAPPPQQPIYFPNNNLFNNTYYNNPQVNNQQFNPNYYNHPQNFSEPNQFQQNFKINNVPVNHKPGNECSGWSDPDYFAENTLREKCVYCNSYQRYGLEPRVIVSCPSDHAFHIGCLSQFRSSEVKNNCCPACREPISNKIRLFCSICKQRSVLFDINEFSDSSGTINTDALLSRYGDTCQKCNRR